MLQHMYGKWDTSLKFYESITENPRYGLQARKMLEIIPVIRSTPEFKEVLGWSAHCILTMGITGKSNYLRVWAEDENTFRVYIEYHDEDRVDSVYVTQEELMPTLIQYLHKIE